MMLETGRAVRPVTAVENEKEENNGPEKYFVDHSHTTVRPLQGRVVYPGNLGWRVPSVRLPQANF